MPLYADVVVPRHLARPFTYRVPETLRLTLRVGDAVLVPFGAVTVRGLVVDVRPTSVGMPDPTRVRAIIGLSRDGDSPQVDSRLLELARWIAEQHLTPLGQCLRLILPPPASPGRAERYIVTQIGIEALAGGGTLSETDHGLVQRLAERPGGTFQALKKGVPALTRAMLTSAMERGLVRTSALLPSSRSKKNEDPEILADEHRASAAVLEADPALRSRIQCKTFSASLLEAPGDVRMTAILTALDVAVAAQRPAIILAPEVRRVEAIWAQVQPRWGASAELWHGERTDGERTAAWQRIQSGAVKIVVGTRAAIFVPLDGVGLIVVEEEDHTAYKEEQEPRYHSRDVAWKRAELEDATLLLCSAHASFETRVRIRAVGTDLRTSSAQAPPLVPVELVHLSHPPHGAVVSAALELAMRETLQAGGRVALYLNRRGYAPALVCTACRMVPRCPHCQLALVYSQESRCVRCRACGAQSTAPDHCQGCQGTHFDLVGCGTERLEAEVASLFPEVRVLRMDRDTAPSRARTARAARTTATTPPWHIAVGTRLMVRELPERSCTLVGIAYAEAGLHVPDFRASERTYQELSDVVSLADSAVGGRVVLQTCLPTHPVIRALVTGDRETWEREELTLREALDYPPFACMIALDVSGSREEDVRDLAGHWAGLLQTRAASLERTDAGSPCAVLGPIPASAVRARGRSRWRLIVKGRDGARVRALVQDTRAALTDQARRRRAKLSVDVDPLDLV